VRAECAQHVAHPAVVDGFRAHLAGTVGAEGEHERVDSVDRRGEGVGSGDITDDQLGLRR
jgi:hypothetical protein